MDFNNSIITFIGGGNMARALLAGLLRAGHRPGALRVADPDLAQHGRVHALSPEITASTDSGLVAAEAELIVLAVKPQVLARVAGSLAPRQGQLVVSVAAGVTLPSLVNWLGAGTPCVRMMPNQPALVGAGMSVLCATPSVSAAQREQATYLAGAGGETAWVDDETLLDAVTAVSGSGPAYFYLLMEILADTARAMGIAPDIARQLAVQTAFGAGLAARETATAPAELRSMVTSPGGTTEAALDALERGNIRALFATALEAARKRSVELGAPEDA